MSNLSGGNQQKVIIARELTGDVKVLLVAQPTRGLDVGSIEFIHRRIVEIRDDGTAVLLVSAELDEIFTLSDRIGVLYRGELVGEFDRDDATRDAVGCSWHPAARTPRRAATHDRGRPDGAAAAAPWHAHVHALLRASSRCSSRSVAILLAFAVGGVIILLVGENPIDAYWALLRGMFGSSRSDRRRRSAGRRRSSAPRSRWRSRSAPACSTSASRASSSSAPPSPRGSAPGTSSPTCRRCSRCSSSSSPASSAVALYGAIPGVLKARTGAHEVITTIMLNSIAVLYVRWMVGSQDPVILRDIGRVGAAHRDPSRRRAGCPTFVAHRAAAAPRASSSCSGSCVLVWFMLQRTTTGFEIRMVGANPHAARYAGISVEPRRSCS